MNPIKVTGENGILYGFACGVCTEMHIVRTKPTNNSLEVSKNWADSCCKCERCDKPIQSGESHHFCEHHELVSLADQSQERSMREATLRNAENRTAAVLLETMMSDTSEQAYAASWMQGCEMDIWDACHGKNNIYSFVMKDGTGPEMIKLAKEANGWWADYNVFVPMSEWEVRVR